MKRISVQDRGVIRGPNRHVFVQLLDTVGGAHSDGPDSRISVTAVSKVVATSEAAGRLHPPSEDRKASFRKAGLAACGLRLQLQSPPLQALDAAFTLPDPDADRVLFHLPVTKAWL